MKLRWTIVSILLAVSMVPLCLTAAGAWVVFGKLLETKALEVQMTVVRNHARAIDSYLEERVHLLQQIASTVPIEALTRPDVLKVQFDALNRVSRDGFVDIGVIDANGDHLCYLGPFELKNRNYREAEWFREAMAEGVHVSDVFLGFRGVPHCVIAVKRSGGSAPWILRATVNSEQFDALVRTGVLGASGEAFVLNDAGTYQTSPASGAILEPAPLPPVSPHEGMAESRVVLGGQEKLLVTTWLNDGRWVLVAVQDAAEVRAPVRKAFSSGMIVVLLSVGLVVVTTFVATWHLTNRIDQANAKREEMVRAFTRSAKLASIGELATGLAHEINNPLAIIGAEQTNISDLVRDLDGKSPSCAELADSAQRIRRQVERCASITTKMLQFGRNRETTVEPTDIVPRLRDIVNLLGRQASVRNITLVLDAEEALPRILLDPLELEQVLVNLINNSFYAIKNGGEVRIAAKSAGAEIVLEVRDTGAGIPPKDLERIFEPFFTTKPVGEGTGLGMSVCYGLVTSWGGRIEAESELGRGTTIRIRLPAAGAVHNGHGGDL